MKEGQSTVGIHRAKVGTVKKEGEVKRVGAREERRKVTSRRKRKIVPEWDVEEGKVQWRRVKKSETLGDECDAPRQRGR